MSDEPVGYIVCTKSGAPVTGRYAVLDEAIGQARIISMMEHGSAAPFQVCALIPVARERCSRCHGTGQIERAPDEVAAGCELGVAYDPCDCQEGT